MNEATRVPLPELHSWWTDKQEQQRDSILATVAASLTPMRLSERVHDAVMGYVKRTLAFEFEKQHLQIDRVIADEIERLIDAAIDPAP